MTIPVLATKLFIPSRRANTVERPRLMDRLSQGLDGKLSLITAPAGFGKTTLVIEWLARQSDQKSAWISLDESDSEPVRFLTYLLAAIQNVYPEFAQSAGSSLSSSQAPNLDFLTDEILNEWARLPGPLVIIWDDYHTVTTEKTHQIVNKLIDYAPAQMHFAITSRDTPPLSLPRWRARGQLTEISAADLRFTPDEAQIFLNRTMGLSLDDGSVRVLESRTEGWAAGLQLAAISLRGTTNADLFVDSFTGQDRRVADYLLTEVLDRQSQETRDFLLQTAILDRFNASLCAAILGRKDPANIQRFLERLEATDLFIVPLDHNRYWYRYHHLFAELLRTRLQLWLTSEEIDGLHLRAAQWYENSEFYPEAVQQAMKAEAHDYSAQLISRIPLHRLWENQTGSLVQKCAKEIPETAILKAPEAAIRIIYAQLLRGKITTVQKYLDLVKGSADIEPAHAIFTSIITRNSGNVEHALELLQNALPGLKDKDIHLKGECFLQTAVCQFHLGRLDLAWDVLQDLLNWLPSGSGRLNMRIEAVGICGSIAKAHGDYFQANQLFQEAQELASSSGTFPEQSGLTAFHLGSIYYQWNDLDQAEKYWAEAMAWGKRTGIMDIVLNALLGKISLQIARGARENASGSLDDFRKLFRANQISPTKASMEAVEAEYDLRLGNLDVAVRWANASRLSFTNAPEFPHISHNFTFTAIRLAENRLSLERSELEQMVQFLDAYIRKAEEAAHTFFLIRLHLYHAQALDLLGYARGALQSLHRSLELAQPGSLLRIFLDQGEPVRQLLEKSLSYDLHRDFVRRLLVDFAREGSARGEESLNSPLENTLSEALTDREYQILQLIAAGFSNKGIAEKLVISKNTVRTHLKNLYGKLGVGSRTQALVRAHEEGLL